VLNTSIAANAQRPRKLLAVNSVAICSFLKKSKLKIALLFLLLKAFAE